MFSIKTPYIYSNFLSKSSQKNIYLKMEAYQATGSFKIRGMENICKNYFSKGISHFISSSGGNAGYATAYIGSKLGVKTTVVVPDNTSKKTVEEIKVYADVIIKGENWNEANDYALKLVDKNSVLIHPFDNELLWDGYSKIIDEIKEENIDCIILSVGGGGLLNGIIKGLIKNNINIPVIGVETIGADSLYQSYINKKHYELKNITSKAKSLGAKMISKQSYKYLSEYDIRPAVVKDEEAIDACKVFLKKQRVAVEIACGASIAIPLFYKNLINNYNNICIIVCGGISIDY